MILDALGTRGIWARSDPAQVAETLAGLTHAFKSGVSEGSHPTGRAYRKLAKLNDLPDQEISWVCQTISDTVITTARSPGPLGALLLFVACEAIPLVATGFEAGVPFRGAIAAGSYFEAGSVLIGPAVDEAAEWHDKLDWAGVVLAPSAADAIETLGKELKFVGGPPFVKTQLPLKDGPLLGYALNWPLDSVPRKVIARAFSRSPVTTDVARKLSRTLAFYDENHG